MIGNSNRVGNFTSSEIVALTKKAKNGKDFGAPALTYIEEANFERQLGRSIDDEKTAKPLTWGHLVERRVFDLLGLEYTLCSSETVMHPEIPFWSGSPDGEKQIDDTLIDIKSPITLKSFCQLVDPLYRGLTGIEAINAVRENHKDGDKYYWQLVSNATIRRRKYAELIVYMPYKSELDEIRVMAQMVEAQEMSKHYWIAMAGEDELPFLLDDGFYKNVNIIRFEVPEADKRLLTECVLRAGEMLINQPKQLAAPDDSTPYEMILDDANALKI